MYQNGSTTLPRGFRYHHTEDRPSTPEQAANSDPEPPQPRQPRFKVKRRNVSSFNGPTSQFLASVAAADTPIPTIEFGQDLEMTDQAPRAMDDGYLSPQPQGFRSGSPPKTPVPNFAALDQGSQFPDWSRDTPERPDYFGRPTSSRSNASDCSDDSYYSGSHLSRPSNDDSTCTSPENDLPDPFHFASISKCKGKEVAREPVITLNGGSTNLIRDTGLLNSGLRSKSRNDAVWSKSQSAHLWATYQVYLQDPTQTPFRFGVSCIPPEGVIIRVARQAKRSWKGPKIVAPLNHIRSTLNAPSRVKSGSNTPTQESSKQYGAWPHSKMATRAHLKELCKSKSTTAVQFQRHLQARSPTPFDRSQQQRSLESRGSFSTQDIAVSLVTSTSETMQPNGPLAKLATETSPITPTLSRAEAAFKPLKAAFGYDDMPRRLGSPFVSQTYGPSSTNSLIAPNNRPAPLRSPISFDQPRSLHNTQKRRAAHDLDAELSPSGAVLRPGILNEQLFGAPINHRRVRNRGFSLGDEAFRQRTPDLLYNPLSDVSRPGMESGFPNLPSPSLMPSVPMNERFTASLHEKFGPPPRLGSPLDFAGTNNTFPRRHVFDNSAPTGRPFATMHQSRRSIESFDFGPSLTSRRTQLAQVKLMEIQEREEALRHHNFR